MVTSDCLMKTHPVLRSLPPSENIFFTRYFPPIELQGNPNEGPGEVPSRANMTHWRVLWHTSHFTDRFTTQ